MHVLLLPFGSAGDVLPYVGLGRALRDRGHRVTVIVSEFFEQRVRGAGLGFAPLGSRQEYLDAFNNPHCGDEKASFAFFAGVVVPAMLRPTFKSIADRYQPGQTVVVACPLVFGARVAQEKLGVPLASIHLQPLMLRSSHAPPVIPALPRLRKIPRFIRPLTFRLLDTVLDRKLGPGINSFRAELGLAPVRRIMADWWNSPRRIIAMFPDWFAPPQPDWPPQTLMTTFPLYDAGDHQPTPPEAETFLAAGDPPLVFSTGSNVGDWPGFFAASMDACRMLGRRGILMTRFRDHVPPNLPDNVRHFDYLPYRRLLPRCAAMVHHGGIGTLSQAMAAGIPQLITPLGLDQPDNAARLEHLGVGRSLHPDEYTAEAAARLLAELIDRPTVLAQCRELASRLRLTDPLSQACAAVEHLAGADR
ncbi:MAG: glycosyltransferase family 1 protein [Phycisphaerae bacterium]|nr:glycosyltransferase family 1 protein [Phycisphaerae bacterium]